MTWLLLTIGSGSFSVAYLLIGALPSRIPVSRRRKFHSAGVTLIAFTVLCLAKYLTHAGS